MALQRCELRKLLSQVYNQLQNGEASDEHDRRKQEFVFHMIDWAADLEKIADLYSHPGKLSPEADKIVVAFLYHAIPHLNTAGNLLLDTIPDPFLKPKDDA